MAIALALIILMAATLLFISGWLRPDLVALLVPVTLYATGIITRDEALSGFISPAVILLLAAFIITEAIRQSGLGEYVSAILVRIAGKSERLLMLSLSLCAAILSLFMNNIAAAAVLMPSGIAAMRRAKAGPRRLLLPMAFATQLAGMATLLTTSNIVMSSVLRNHGLPGFGLLEFLPVGGPITIIGLAVMILIAPRLLPDTSERFLPWEEREQFASLAELYGLQGDFHVASMLPGSPLAGTTLASSGLCRRLDINIVAICHSTGQVILTPGSKERLAVHDRLIYTPSCPDSMLNAWGLQAEPADGRGDRSVAKRVGLTEAVIGPRSSLANKSLLQTRFRQRYGVTVLAIWRNGRAIRQGIKDMPLQFGDALLLQGPHQHLKMLATDSDLIVLGREEGAKPHPEKSWISLGIIAAALALAATGCLPVAETLFAGAVLLVLTRRLTMDDAYEAIDWRSILIVGSMLSVGTALNKTGAATLMAELIMNSLGRFGPFALLAGFAGLTVILTQFIPGGAAIPLIIGPIAISAGLHAGANPRAFAVAVAIATSTSFLTPFSHPVNLLVMGPGGYRSRDYLRLGLPLAALTLILTLLLVPLVYPLL